MFNHDSWIAGYENDDHSSMDCLYIKIEQLKIKGIVFGDCCYDDLNFYKYHNKKFAYPPKIEPFTNDSIFGRQNSLNYFQKEFPYNLE